MQFPITIELQRSVRFSVLVFVSHIVALGSVYVLPWGWNFRLFFVALIAFSAWSAVRAPRLKGFRILSADKLDGVLGDGSLVRLAICEQSVVYRRVIVLRVRFDDDDKPTSLVLFSDQTTTANFHQLRLWLRGQVVSKKDLEGAAF